MRKLLFAISLAALSAFPTTIDFVNDPPFPPWTESSIGYIDGITVTDWWVLPRYGISAAGGVLDFRMIFYFPEPVTNLKVDYYIPQYQRGGRFTALPGYEQPEGTEFWFLPDDPYCDPTSSSPCFGPAQDILGSYTFQTVGITEFWLERPIPIVGSYPGIFIQKLHFDYLSAIPEPSTFALAAAGAVLVMARRLLRSV